MQYNGGEQTLVDDAHSVQAEYIADIVEDNERVEFRLKLDDSSESRGNSTSSYVDTKEMSSTKQNVFNTLRVASWHGHSGRVSNVSQSMDRYRKRHSSVSFFPMNMLLSYKMCIVRVASAGACLFTG